MKKSQIAASGTSATPFLENFRKEIRKKMKTATHATAVEQEKFGGKSLPDVAEAANRAFSP